MTASSNSSFVKDEKSSPKNSTAESRRASKPLMEKRRRARINSSLAVLKGLIVDSQRVEGQKHAKLEKADILEMTVAHLQNLKKSDEQKFMEGFKDCFSETIKFLEKSKIRPSIIDTLTEHLNKFQATLDMPLESGSLLKGNGTSGGSCPTSSSTDEELDSANLLSLPFTEAVDQSHSCATFVPRQKRAEPTSLSLITKLKKAPSSTHSHSSCLSPSFSNDSNNNTFTPTELDGFRPHISPSPAVEHGYPGPFDKTFDTNAPSYLEPPTSEEQAFVLNLSTHNRSSNPTFSSRHVYNHNHHNNDHDSSKMEPMDDCPDPSPLNLSKHPAVLYRLSEDGVWRPW